MTENKKKIYVFDLDNTLCRTDGCNYMDATPLEKRIKKVNKLHDEGHMIIIETARGNVSGKNWLFNTIWQLKEWGVKYDHVRTNIKFGAECYVDDLAVNSKEFFGENKTAQGEYLKRESGGKTKVVLVSRVLKSAADERVEKLIDEINYIESVPEKWKKYFPEIVMSSVDNDKEAYYEMKHYGLPSLRRLIHSGEFDCVKSIYWVEKMMKFLTGIYSHEKVKMDNYVQIMHFDRIERRLKEIEEKSEVIRNIMCWENIEINGKTYKNIPYILKDFKDKKVVSSIQPECISKWSHSDLHFSNVLVNIKEDRIIALDPRGYPASDIYYDVGKIWHSVNGCYEFIADHLFELNIEKHQFSLIKNKVYDVCQQIKRELPALFDTYLSENITDIMRKVEFNEAIHFASLIPFLFDSHDEKNERSVVAYYTAVILMNDFMKKYF